MKKTLLFAIIALSINAFAQSKLPMKNSMENIRSRWENTGIKTSDIHSEINFGQVLKYQTSDPSSLIQIFDSVLEWQWDTLSIGWKIYDKYINIVYDAKNNLISYIGQEWKGSAWVNSSKYSLTYDASNNRTSELDQDWNGSAWVNSYLYTSTYDASNNQTSELDQSWNGSAWVNTYQYTNTYDAKNNLISELDQSWNGTAWVDSFKDTYTYNVNNKPTNELNQSWNGSVWVNSWQSTYTYDAYNNQTSELNQNWNGSVWVNSYQYLSSYDANNFEKSYSDKNWNSTGAVVISGDSSYYYYHTVLGINDLMVPLISIIVYPNPSYNKITIETSAIPTNSQLSIMNLSGQELITRPITEPKTQIDISTLPSGVYFVRLTNDRTVEMGKFIKQ